MRVLTLDDSPLRQLSFRRWFAGLLHAEAYTAQEAIEALQAGPRFDLVQLDHDLSEEHYIGDTGLGTGMDVVDHIIRMEPGQRPYRAIVHSWNMPRAQEMVRRLEEAGVWVRYCRFDPNKPTFL